MLMIKRKLFWYQQLSDWLQVQLPHQPYSFVEVGMDLAAEHHGHYSLIFFFGSFCKINFADVVGVYP